MLNHDVEGTGRACENPILISILRQDETVEKCSPPAEFWNGSLINDDDTSS